MTTETHEHTPDEEREIREAALDETVAASFPASDPPSTIPNPDEHDADATAQDSVSESARQIIDVAALIEQERDRWPDDD